MNGFLDFQRNRLHFYHYLTVTYIFGFSACMYINAGSYDEVKQKLSSTHESGPWSCIFVHIFVVVTYIFLPITLHRLVILIVLLKCVEK